MSFFHAIYQEIYDFVLLSAKLHSLVVNTQHRNYIYRTYGELH